MIETNELCKYCKRVRDLESMIIVSKRDLGSMIIVSKTKERMCKMCYKKGVWK